MVRNFNKILLAGMLAAAVATNIHANFGPSLDLLAGNQVVQGKQSLMDAIYGDGDRGTIALRHWDLQKAQQFVGDLQAKVHNIFSNQNITVRDLDDIANIRNHAGLLDIALNRAAQLAEQQADANLALVVRNLKTYIAQFCVPFVEGGQQGQLQTLEDALAGGQDLAQVLAEREAVVAQRNESARLIQDNYRRYAARKKYARLQEQHHAVAAKYAAAQIKDAQLKEISERLCAQAVLKRSQFFGHLLTGSKQDLHNYRLDIPENPTAQEIAVLGNLNRILLGQYVQLQAVVEAFGNVPVPAVAVTRESVAQKAQELDEAIKASDDDCKEQASKFINDVAAAEQVILAFPCQGAQGQPAIIDALEIVTPAQQRLSLTARLAQVPGRLLQPKTATDAFCSTFVGTFSLIGALEAAGLMAVGTTMTPVVATGLAAGLGAKWLLGYNWY